MGEMLSSLDVVNKAFKKTMRGYDPAEVDEFLDRVAESIQAYVQQTKEFERVMDEQKEKLRDYEKIKGSLHEALLMAQRTAEEKVANAIKAAEERLVNATTTADGIIADARAQAEHMLQEAELSVARYGEELRTLQQFRGEALARMRAFASEIWTAVDTTENGGGIQIPDFTQETMRRNEGRVQLSNRASKGDDAQAGAIPYAESATAAGDGGQLDITETLSVLGIDPNLLNVGTDSF